jgi:probable F420-dependent oxidoreductase
MKFGLFGINIGPCADPDVAGRVAVLAEEVGFESLWTGEHVVLPDPQVAPSPSPPETPFVDPAVCLAFVAAQTKSIRLGTGIIILPQRNPLVLAKELASVDVVSKGRLIFGLGIGYLKPEFDALGIPFEHKGPRAMEHLDAMLAVWTQERPSFQGKFVSFSAIQAFPRPVQKPHPPIVIGGMSPQAFRRAVTRANGWYGFALDVDGTEACLSVLREAQNKYGRPPELGPLEISITPRGRVDEEMAQRFAALGVHRLILYRQLDKADDFVEYVRRFGDDVIARVS